MERKDGSIDSNSRHTPLRWGILGCGGIARRMAGAIASRENMRLEAVAARDKERAGAFASAHGAARHYGGYDGLLADDGVDAVYVATIHPAHYEAVRACLLALFRLAEEKNLLLMEAMWSRYLPAWREAVSLAGAGELGKLKGVTADFSARFPFDPSHRLYDPAQGGGTLLDLGVYAIHLAFSAFGPDYCAAQAAGRLAPTGVDVFAALTLEYPGGGTAILTCAGDQAGPQEALLIGENGWISLPRFYQATEYTLHREGMPDEVRHFEKADGFAYELEEFRRLLHEGQTESAVVPHRDTLAALRLIEWGMRAIRCRHGLT